MKQLCAIQQKGFSLLIFLCFCIASIAQPINSLVGDVVQPTPGAASLGQYGDNPVSYVTGTPSISIPLQGIQEGKLSLPISLNYHASGIKVAQMASWVGLGWSLNAGGSISRTVQDINDETPNNGYYYNTLDVTDETIFCQELKGGTEFDSEPDIFVINLPTTNAKFFIDHDHNVQIVDKTQQLNVSIVLGTGTDLFKGFVVTSADGTKYFFGHYNETDAKESLFVNNTNSTFTNEWKLLAMETYDGADKIEFTYVVETYNYKSLSNCIKQVGVGLNTTICPGLNGYIFLDSNAYPYNKHDVSGLRLSEITTGSGTKSLTFLANTQRIDISGTAFRLDILEYNTGSFCKQYKFDYNYFEDPLVIEGYGKRLKLLKLWEESCDQTEIIEPYVFDYISSSSLNANGSQYLPHRLSKRIDHWGYFNDRIVNDNDLVLVPSTVALSTGSGSLVSFGGSDRSSNPDVMDYGVLERITYPHKGVSVFEYEPHCVSGIDASSSAMELEFVSTCGTVGNSCCGELMETTSPVSFTSQSQINSLKFDLNITEPVPGCNGVQPNVVLEMYSGSVLIGNYQLVLPDGEMFANALDIDLNSITNTNLSRNTFYTFKLKSYEGRGEFKLYVDNYSTTNVVIGGLRIKEITTHDGIDASRDIVKSYDYELDNSVLSSGQLLSSPVYGVAIHNLNCLGEPYDYRLEWRGIPITPLSEYEGRQIVYTRVVENVEGMGSTEYLYNSDANPYPTNYTITLPQLVEQVGGTAYNNVLPPRVYDYSNGELLHKKMYDSNDNLVREESYERSISSGYEETPFTVFKSTCYKECMTGSDLEKVKISANFYRPRTGWYLLGKKTSTQDGVITIEEYTYDINAGHYSPKTHSITNSDNRKHITVYSYPEDYIVDEDSDIGSTMKDLNLILPAWKTEKYISTTQESNRVDGNKIIWGTYGTNIYPKTFKRWEKTFTAGGADEAGANWDSLYTIVNYNSAVGQPSKVNYVGWEDDNNSPIDHELTWSNSGRLKKDVFLDYEKIYNYYTNTDLLKEAIDIDETSKSYTYDALIRPLTIKDDQRGKTDSLKYYYRTGNTDYSYSQLFTKYELLGTTSRTHVNRTYYDGLGRSIQLIKRNRGPSVLNSIVISTEYDAQGRVKYNYEPRQVSNTLNYQGYAGVKDTTIYEASPLSRILSKSDAAGFKTTYQYGTNNFPNAITGYAIPTCYRITGTDGRGNKSHTYKDRLGNIVYQRTEDGSNSNNKADTRTIYDKKLRPTKIIPPDAVSSDVNLVTTYLYYGNDQIKEKKIPDAEKIEYKYDERDLLTFSRDGEQRSDNKWMMFDLDEYGRIENEGWSTNGTSMNQVYLENQWGNTGNSAGKIEQQTKYITYNTSFNNTHYYIYDNAGRLKTKEYSTLLLSADKAIKETYTYDSADNVLTQTNYHTGYPLENNIFTFTYNYDHAGRPFTTYFGRNTSATNLLCTKIYTPKNQVARIDLGDNSLQSIHYSYLNNQFLDKINGSSLAGTDLFQMNLDYDLAANIDRWDWHTQNDVSSYYTYTYDFLDRLTFGRYNGNFNNKYSSSYVYNDFRGNLKSIFRRGNTNGSDLDNMIFNYNGATNCFTSISDSGELGLLDAGYSGMAGTYDFDKNGAMIEDPSRQASIRNEHFNLPRVIEKDANNKINYHYDWTGTLHRTTTKTDGVTEQRDYVGAAEYVNGTLDLIKHENGFIKPDLFNNGLLYRAGDTDHDDIKYWETIHTEEVELPINNVELYFKDYGEMTHPFEVKSDTEYLISPESSTGDQFFWNIKDHLGNIRVVFDDNLKILEKNNYYAFGMRWTDQQPQFNYTYNSKEEQRGIGVGLINYGARFHDVRIGRFISIDPLVEELSNLTPFNYTYNNPIRFIDPDGKMAEPPGWLSKIWDTAVDVYTTLRDGTKGMISNTIRSGLESMGSNTGQTFSTDSDNQMMQYEAMMSNAGQVALDIAPDVIAESTVALAETVVADGLLRVKPQKAPVTNQIYKRPNNATTKAQREFVQDKPCSTCGATGQRNNADHKYELVREHYETGGINETRMRQLNSVQPQCANCSNKQGAEMSKYSKEMKKIINERTNK